MTFPFEPAKRLRAEPEDARQRQSKIANAPTNNRARFFFAVIAAGVFLGLTCGSSAFAKTSKQADTKDASAIDPSAMEALNKLGAYLRTLQSFQVTTDMTTDEVLEDGQTIQTSTTVNLLASRPNRLRVELNGDEEHRFYFFDGKQFTIYGQLVNYYATVPAPPTIAKLLQDLNDKYAIELPMVDLFKWGTDDANVNKIKGAQDIGPSAVGGVTCEQYAFHQDDVDWQIWIQLGEFPLPRKLVIRSLSDDAKPQHSEILTWNLAPSFSGDAFTFDPPSDAKRIAIAEVKGDTTSAKQ
jgi:hypothetical protein